MLVLYFLGCSDQDGDIIQSAFFAGTKDSTSTQAGKSIKFSKYVVTYDNNNDGIINKGETVYLQVYLKNNGTETVSGVQATMTTTSSYISGLSPTSWNSFGDITPNSQAYASYGYDPNYNDYSWKFTVSSSTPVGTSITFNLTIADYQGNSWTQSFTVTVQATGANIQYSKYVVTYDNNNDGIINKGETVYLQLYLKNVGSSTAKGVSATMTTTSSYISGLSPTSSNSFGDITPNSQAYASYGYDPNYNDYSWMFTVSSSTPVGTSITFNLAITDGQGNSWTQSFTVTVQATGANIQYSKYVVTYDNNHDGIINKGETVYLQLYLKNVGSSTAKGVSATMTTTSSYISGFSPTSSNSFGDMTPNSQAYASYGYDPNYNDYSWKFTVSSSTPVGTSITFNFAITDGQSNAWSSSFAITVQ